MSRTAFENLDIYKLSERLAQAVWSIAKEWSPLARDTIGKQLIRAADSIGANIAEGFGRGNGQDQKRFIRIARGSVYEVKHWLRLAFGRGLLNTASVDVLRPILNELPPMPISKRLVVRELQQSTFNNPQSEISHGNHSN